MHMAQTLFILQNKRLVLSADTVIVTDVKGQSERRRVQKEAQRLLLKIRKAVAVFDADQDAGGADGVLTLSSERGDAFEIPLLILREEIYPPVRQGEIHPAGQVHVEDGDAEFFCQRDGFKHSALVAVRDVGVEVADVQIFIQVDRIEYAVLLRNAFEGRRVDRLDLVLGQVHIELHKIQPQLPAERRALVKRTCLDQGGHTEGEHGKRASLKYGNTLRGTNRGRIENRRMGRQGCTEMKKKQGFQPLCWYDNTVVKLFQGFELFSFSRLFA